MSNLTYNPNVNIPYHSNQFNRSNDYEEPMNNYERNNGRQHFDRNNLDRNNLDRNNFDRNNFDRNNDTEFDRYNDNFENNDNYYDMTRTLPQMDPRGDPRGSSRMNRNNISKKSGLKNKSKSIINEKYSNDEKNHKLETDSKIKWILIFKKIAIITILFLLMSSVKMDELVCKFVPYLNENQLICMTIKGIILSVLIIIIQLFL
jgi:hypothetical protein